LLTQGIVITPFRVDQPDRSTVSGLVRIYLPFS